MPFSLIDQPKRGFSGRPLIALLFAVGMGILAAYVAPRWQLSGPAVSIILVALGGIAGCLWFWFERPAVKK